MPASPAWQSDETRYLTRIGNREFGMSDKKKSGKEQKTDKEQDDYLDEALEETFPASDPIAPGHTGKKPSDKK
jgi:hypothetical protein